MDPARLAHFEAIRGRRQRHEPDLSLAFLADAFEREVARPHRQLGDLATLWAELVPPALASHTRLESLRRGVLTVAVDTSAHLYEVDRLLPRGVATGADRAAPGPGVPAGQAARRGNSR